MPEKMPERRLDEIQMNEQEQILDGIVSVREILNYIEQDRFLTLKEAAAYVRLSQRTLRRQINQIQPRPFKYGGKLLFKKSDLDQWMEQYRFWPDEGVEDFVDGVLMEVGE